MGAAGAALKKSSRKVVPAAATALLDEDDRRAGQQHGVPSTARGRSRPQGADEHGQGCVEVGGE